MMIWIITFLGIIAVAEVGSFLLNTKNRDLQLSIEMLEKQLERERERYNDDRKQFEKDLATNQDAVNLWAKKYYELEILLKKAEHHGTEGTDTPRDR